MKIILTYLIVSNENRRILYVLFALRNEFHHKNDPCCYMSAFQPDVFEVRGRGRARDGFMDGRRVFLGFFSGFFLGQEKQTTNNTLLR